MSENNELINNSNIESEKQYLKEITNFIEKIEQHINDALIEII